jgi:NADPH2:quinone reductase
MVHAITIHEHGGPDKLVWEAVDVPAPGNGQIRVKHHAVGLNYIDTYQREGLYKLPSLPAVLGMPSARASPNSRLATGSPMPIPWAATPKSA